MKYFLAPRSTGKTGLLVQECHKNQGVLVVTSNAHKKYVINQVCPALNIPPEELHIINAYQFFIDQGELSNYKNRPIYIDDFSAVMHSLFGNVAMIADSLD